MLDFIEKLFIEAEYSLSRNSTQTNRLFEKSEKEYFLLSDYSKDQLLEFFVSKKTKELLSFFEDTKREIHDLEKNTSLIICLKVDDLRNDTEKLKNQIFKIEEDDYFFKKYVIIYSDNSIVELINSNNIIQTIHEKIQESNMFAEFQKDYFFDEEFFLLIQLFVKIPFVKFEQEDEEFQNLSDIINHELEDKKLNLIEKCVLSTEFDLEYIENSFLNGTDTSEEVRQYIDSFKNKDDENQ